MENEKKLDDKNIEIDKIFYKLQKKEKKPFNLNLSQKIKKENRNVKKLIINAFGKETITEKPDSLIKLEKQLKTYFFGIEGNFTYLIPNLRNQLLLQEKKKFDELDNKIPFGDLTFFNLTENDKNITIEKRRMRNIIRNEIINSSNFSLLKKTNKINNLSQLKRKKLFKFHSPNQRYNTDIYLTSFSREDSKNNFNHTLSSFRKIKPIKTISHKILSSTRNNTFTSLVLDKMNSKKETINNLKKDIYKKRICYLIKENDKKNQIEQYSIKKPLILDSYLNAFNQKKNNYKIKNKKLNINSFKKLNNKKLKEKLDVFSFHENKISKSLYNIINKNKIDKDTSKLKNDIEVVFEQKIKEEKKNKMLKKNSDEDIKENDNSNNHLVDIVKNSKIKQIPKEISLKKGIKLTQYILQKENEQFNVVRKKFKQGLQLIQNMKSKIYFDHIKLKNKIEERDNHEKELLIQEKINYMNYKKNEESD